MPILYILGGILGYKLLTDNGCNGNCGGTFTPPSPQQNPSTNVWQNPGSSPTTINGQQPSTGQVLLNQGINLGFDLVRYFMRDQN